MSRVVIRDISTASGRIFKRRIFIQKNFFNRRWNISIIIRLLIKVGYLMTEQTMNIRVLGFMIGGKYL